MSNLPTNLVSDLLNTEVNTYRRYNILDSNGEAIEEDVHLEEITSYTQRGSEVTAELINEICKRLNDNTFSIATSDWVANTDTSTNERFPYVAVKTSALFSADSRPIWQMEGANGIPTETEYDAINLILDANFDTNGVTLYATDEVEVALTLVVKGV